VQGQKGCGALSFQKGNSRMTRNNTNQIEYRTETEAIFYVTGTRTPPRLRQPPLDESSSTTTTASPEIFLKNIEENKKRRPGELLPLCQQYFEKVLTNLS